MYVILFILAALGLRFSSWGDGAALQGTDSVAVEPGLSCPEEYRIFPDQGSNSCLLCWQAEPSPLSHQGSPRGLGPSDEPPTPSQPLAVICATPLRCSHPPDGHLGEACTLSASQLQGRGWALSSQDITVSGGPLAARRGPVASLRGVCQAGGWMRADPGRAQSPGPSGQEGGEPAISPSPARSTSPQH